MNQTAPPLNATQYAAELFPKLTPEEAGTIAELYAGLGSEVTQDSRIMGEGASRWSSMQKIQLTSQSYFYLSYIFLCGCVPQPHFQGKSQSYLNRFKWRSISVIISTCQAELAVGQALHGDDSLFYWPS